MAVKNVDAAMADGYTIPDIANLEGLDLSSMDWKGALNDGHLPSDIVSELRIRSMTETVSTPSLGMPGVEISSPDMRAAPGDETQLDASGVTAESLPLIFSMAGGRAIGPAGSGVGAAGGVMARDAMYNMWGADERGGQFDPLEMMKTGSMFAGVDAAVGAAGRTIIGVAEREGIKDLGKAFLIDPFGKETAKRTVAMMEYVKANNLPVNPTNYLTGPISKSMAWIADALPGGGSASKRAQAKLGKRLMEVASKEMVDWGDEVVPEGVILDAAVSAMNKTSKVLKAGGKEAGFEEIKAVLKTQADGLVPVTKSRQAVLNAIKEVKGDKATAKKFKKTITFLEDRFLNALVKKGDTYYISSESLIDIYGGIWETMTKPQMRTNGGRMFGGLFKEGVTDDLNAFGATLDEAIEYGTKLREADDVFKIGTALAKTSKETRASIGKGQTRNAITNILFKEDPVTVKKMLSAMENAGYGEEVELVKKQFLYNMAKSSVKHGEESGVSTFKVSKFLEDWELVKPRALEIFGEETFKKWDEFAGWLASHQDDIKKVQKPNELLNKLSDYTRFAATVGAAAGANKVGGPVVAGAVLTVPSMFAYLLANMMHNPKVISSIAQSVPIAAESMAAMVKGGITVNQMNKKKKKKSYNPADMLTP